MKTILMATAAFTLLAAPALAQDMRKVERDVADKTETVLNGTLDFGTDVMINPSEISGETTVEISDQIDSVTGRVMASSTNVTRQMNAGDLSSVSAVGINAGNRSADITAAAIGNSLSVVNGISQ